MINSNVHRTYALFKGLLAALACSALLLVAGPAAAQDKKDEAIEYAKDSSTEINVKNADIAAVVRIFSKKTKRNYILDETVKGKVTIYLPGKVSSDEAIRILDAVLALKGFTSVPIGENLWKIVQIKEAKTTTIPTHIDSAIEDPSSAVATRLINLKFVSAEDMQQLVSPLVSPEGLINAYTGTNSLMIIDSEDNIQRIAEIISALDVPSSDREMTIVPVLHADAPDIAEKLNQILGIGGDAGKGSAANVDLVSTRAAEVIRANAGRPGAPGAPAAPSSAISQTIAARAREPKIIPDERTNSIIIVADDDTTARMKALIDQLDSEVDLSGFRFYVYRCQHANAEELADILSTLSGGSGTTGGRDTSRGSFGGSSFSRNQGDNLDAGPFGVGRSSTSARSRNSRLGTTPERLDSRARAPGGSANQNRSGAGTSAINLGENISISADPATNSLIIYGSKADYEKIVQLLKQLDVKRRQVLVEAILLEVGVDDSNSMSTEFLTSTGGADGGVAVKSDFGNLASLFQNPNALSSFSVAAASAGTLTLPGGIKVPTQSVLLRAAKENANANVLSSPNILATDNEPAYIIVGQNVPFVASQATSDVNLNNTFNQIDRQDVGITLRLTPQISSEDYVTLNIFTEVSNLLERTLASPLGPTTTVRTSETTAIAKDGQMIVIGGLMSDDNTDAESGVPFLSDIPVLGHLFRSTASRTRRTNLLIFITPHIVKDPFDARDATIISREKMEDVIFREDTYPNRREILRSPAIDEVTESIISKENPPGTIIPPKKPHVPAAAAAPLEKSSTLRTDSEGAIELKVSPELPASAAPPSSEPQESEEISLTIGPESEFRASFSSDLPEQSRFQESAKVVVMELENNSQVPSNLPFKVLEDQGVFVLMIPPDSNAYSRGFFQMGEKYKYAVDNNEVVFSPLAVLSSAAELQANFPGLADKLYTLSPYEIMNIGMAPWSKAG
ncbi:MAG: type II secretion system secretin GspD [Deltaproteobacteria bacterium]|nr:type II secretion system secretin GspD [Deltaproteobacteria bacterium]